MAFTKRNLPHLYFEFGIYFVTFRLADSMPSDLVAQAISLCSKITDKDIKTRRLFQKYESFLDSGKYGSNHLTNDNVAGIVKYCLHYPDGEQFRLICYTVMSNHVHTVLDLLEGNKGLDKIMQSIKGISARQSNKILNQSGKFWQDESFDRLIRNEHELWRTVKYVLNNPVKAGLVSHWKDWNHSYCHPDFVEFIPEEW